ncbi:MAG: diguanylate cyclase [Syntrophales bacterium]|jgi:diguanylate cyclase (GGDEF)-like protein/PAS domain S-box-containing protein|nr:diguanylate cyclase [Syntrophales bacterium]
MGDSSRIERLQQENEHLRLRVAELEGAKQERDGIEDALRQSELKFRNLTENMSDWVWETDAAGNFTYSNPPAAELTGLSLGEIIGKPFLSLLEPSDAERVGKMLRDAVARREPLRRVEFKLSRKDGRSVVIEMSGAPILDGRSGSAGCRGVNRDVTERKILEAELLYLAITDPLTGLYNRRGFVILTEQQFRMAVRTNHPMLVFFADMDRLKDINDRYGHEEGDRAIKEAAEILRETFRGSDVIARVGGDEFAVLVINAAVLTPETIQQRLENQIEAHNRRPGRAYRISISAGTAPYHPQNAATVDALLTAADQVMYANKRSRSRRD